MMSRNRVPRKTVWVFVVCLMVLGPASIQVWAGEQIVRLTEVQEADSSTAAKERALLLAVVREAETLLPQPLSPARKKLLSQFLKSRHSKYVLTYSRLEAGNAQLAWQVHVNSQALTDLLQGLGAYYTPDQTLTYILHLTTQNKRGQERIAQLERLSGCIQGDVQYPVLTVQIAADGGWKGTLRARTDTWTASAQDLDSVWLSLWSAYFNTPEGVQPFVHLLNVQISGWSTVSALSGFSHQLNNWPQLVVQGVLLQVIGNSEGLHGWWNIRTSRRQGLEQRLEEYVQARGLKLDIRDTSAEGQGGDSRG